MRRVVGFALALAILLPLTAQAGPASNAIAQMEDRITALEARVAALEEAWQASTSPTPSTSPSPSPSAPSSPSATPTATPSVTATPSPSPSPTSAPTPTATASATASGGTVPTFGTRPASSALSYSGTCPSVIENKTFRDLGANVIAIRLSGCSNVTIRNVDFWNVAEGVYAENSTNIRVEDSRYLNITGPHQRDGSNRANFVQFNGVTGGTVARNKGRCGDTEDIVSAYKSTTIVIEDNHFEGGDGTTGCIAWSSASGSCIALGDDVPSSGNIARRNVCVNPGQVGIFIAGGTNHRIEDNILIGEKRPNANVGIYVWNQYAGTCSGHTVARNRVSWVNAAGTPNPYWNAGNCGSVAGTGNVLNDSTLRAADYRVVL